MFINPISINHVSIKNIFKGNHLAFGCKQKRRFDIMLFNKK